MGNCLTSKQIPLQGTSVSPTVIKPIVEKKVSEEEEKKEDDGGFFI